MVLLVPALFNFSTGSLLVCLEAGVLDLAGVPSLRWPLSVGFGDGLGVELSLCDCEKDGVVLVFFTSVVLIIGAAFFAFMSCKEDDWEEAMAVRLVMYW